MTPAERQNSRDQSSVGEPADRQSNRRIRNEILQNDESKDSEDNIRSLIAIELQDHFIGPLPPPEVLQSYEQIHPGLAEEFLEAWREQRSHRQHLEGMQSERAERRMDRGQIMAFGVALAGLIV